MSIPNAPFGLLGNAPMQTQLVDNQRSVTPPWGGWLNWLRQWLFLNIPSIITTSTGITSSANPIANGAFGDNLHDDTAILQQTINQTGSLYLPPGKVFLISSSILLPTNLPANQPIYIWGGGLIGGTANPVFSGLVSTQNIQILGVGITSSTAAATLISIANQAGGQAYNRIEGCFIACPGGGASVGIALNANQTNGWLIIGCTFQSNIATQVALTNQTGVVIDGCEFRNTTGTIVSTSGTCTYNVVGCNVAPHYGAPALNQYGEFTGTTQTITAGAGFTAVTSCTFTISATGTWQISANAFVQQASAAANSATIRVTRNGVADLHQAASGSPPTGEFMLNMVYQEALTVGDVMVLQCSAVGVNATLLGTGNTGTTNLGGVFLTT